MDQLERGEFRPRWNRTEIMDVLPSRDAVIVVCRYQERSLVLTGAAVAEKRATCGIGHAATHDKGKRSPNKAPYLRSASPFLPVRESSIASRIM
jgi:hypothetical protein